MKILVLGASGMAGHVVALYLQEQGYNVIAYTRQPFQYCENIIGDVTDTEKFKHILSGNNYDAVINCIGLLNQFAEIIQQMQYSSIVIFLILLLIH